MLRIFRIDTSNARISISIFALQGPFSQVQSLIHTCTEAVHFFFHTYIPIQSFTQDFLLVEGVKYTAEVKNTF